MPQETRTLALGVDRSPRVARSARVEELDGVLRRDPGAADALAERAGLLREEGDFGAAKRDYLALLQHRPTDFAALNDFGTLVLKAGYSEAARSLFSEAVRHHPDNPTGRVNLANLLFLQREFEAARVEFETALRIDPAHIHAHRGMANLLGETGEEPNARRHRDRGFKNDFLTTLPYRGVEPPVPVLLLVSARGGNIPTSTLLDDRTFQTTVLVAEYYDHKRPLPPQHLVFNGIGDADLCREGLEAASSVVARTDSPVINHPLQVLKTGRAANVERLRGLPNVVVPRMVRLSRRLLMGPQGIDAIRDNGFSFPLLVRAPGFHTGLYFVRVETPEGLVPAIASYPSDDVWLIEQLDARDDRGMFRKLRVMFVDRKIYPLHLAISRDWKVHYFRADMAQSAQNRTQDAAFLDGIAGFIGQRAVAALERIRAALDLDYGGIDFAVSAQGDILFFEANATMVMTPLAPDEKWDYRRPAFDTVFAAVRAMLLARSASGAKRRLGRPKYEAI